MNDKDADKTLSQREIDALLKSTHPESSDAKVSAFSELQACMQDLIGGSGHLASYSLDAHSFRELSTQIANGLRVISFQVKGFRVSEFQDNAVDKPDLIEGSITLNDEGRVVRNSNGKPVFTWNIKSA